MAAPNSAHTRPSQAASTAPNTQPRIACGPCIASTISGRVTNGPTPIILIMFSEIAPRNPIPRTSPSSLAKKPHSHALTTPTVKQGQGTGRVPYVRQGVRGPKTMGEALQSLLLKPPPSQSSLTLGYH